MNITSSRDGKVFFIDDDKVMIEGKMYYEKAPQNLPEADAYSLLGEVIADIETASEPIQNALYATGRFTTEQCDELADGILQYIKDAGLFIGKR